MKIIFKSLKIITLISCFSTVVISSSCSSKQSYTLNDLLNLYEKPKDFGSHTVEYENDPCHYFLNDVKNKCFISDTNNISKEMLYDTFHFINIKGYELGDCKFTKDNESLIDLYNNNIVNFSFVYSSINRVEPYSSNEESGYKIIFSAMLEVTYKKKYSASSGSNPIQSGTTLSYIGEFQENNFLALNKDPSKDKIPENWQEYYKSSEGTINKYHWRPFFPSYADDLKIFGIIRSNIFPNSIFEITNDYMTESTWINYDWINGRINK